MIEIFFFINRVKRNEAFINRGYLWIVLFLYGKLIISLN